ncbi:hypothetical protein [Micromonospora sp. NPDC050276]|uniref:hypothetical protein n=1 Tax=Micromonospora sp. NPDC050276 TaxID=3364278 RepID=UPI0037A6F950
MSTFRCRRQWPGRRIDDSHPCVSQTYDELRFHYNSIVERHLSFNRRFIDLYEQSRAQHLTDTPIRELTTPAARALPPSLEGR